MNPLIQSMMLPITLALATYPEANPPPTKRYLVIDIQQTVATYYGIPLQAMTSRHRLRNVARPRQVAMYLSRRMTRMSLPEIARRFGPRDHTTVLHAVNQIERLRLEHGDLDNDLRVLQAELAA